MPLPNAYCKKDTNFGWFAVNVFFAFIIFIMLAGFMYFLQSYLYDISFDAHIFTPEDGTKAALMEHVDMEEAQRRAELAVDVQSDIIDAYNDSILGEEREVLCEGYDSQAQMFYGRSYAESPDIDGRIWFTTDSEIAPGSFVNVRLTGTMDGETTGELV